MLTLFVSMAPGPETEKIAEPSMAFQGKHEPKAVAIHEYRSGGVKDALEFLKRTRWELRMLRKVHVHRDKLLIFDVNNDWFEITGVGYPSPEVTSLLDAVNTAYNRETIHAECDQEYKEFKTGRRYCWAADRVM